MSKWTAPSDLDYYDAQDRYDRSVEAVCEDCGEPFDVSFVDGPPVGRPICPSCLEELETQRRRDTLRQWVEHQKVGR